MGELTSISFTQNAVWVGLIPRMLSRSRLCRRLHGVADLAYKLFHQLGEVLKQASISNKY